MARTTQRNRTGKGKETSWCGSEIHFKIERRQVVLYIRFVPADPDWEDHQPAIVARDDRAAARERELEVLRLFVQGCASKQIADAVSLAKITVKVHVSHILEKLGAPDHTRAATPAIERGLIRI